MINMCLKVKSKLCLQWIYLKRSAKQFFSLTIKLILNDCENKNGLIMGDHTTIVLPLLLVSRQSPFSNDETRVHIQFSVCGRYKSSRWYLWVKHMKSFIKCSANRKVLFLSWPNLNVEDYDFVAIVVWNQMLIFMEFHWNKPTYDSYNCSTKISWWSFFNCLFWFQKIIHSDENVARFVHHILICC